MDSIEQSQAVVFNWAWTPSDGIGPKTASELSSTLRQWITALKQHNSDCCVCEEIGRVLNHGVFNFTAASADPDPQAPAAAQAAQALGETAGLLAQLTAVLVSGSEQYMPPYYGQHSPSAVTALAQCFQG